MTRITMLIDKSGSMHVIEKAAMDGFNEFLDAQQGLGQDARVTLRLFSTGPIETVYTGSIAECPYLTPRNYDPDGGTALLDAVGDTLVKLLKGYNEMTDKPKMVVCILTDGKEMDSYLYKKHTVQMLISEAKALGWEFVFLGAGTNWAYGVELGIEPKNVLDFKANPDGVKDAFKQISDSVSRLRLESK